MGKEIWSPRLASNVSSFIDMQVQNLQHRWEEATLYIVCASENSFTPACLWQGVGGGWWCERLFPIPAASVQYACNNRNFANRRETGLCPLLSRQPKPQSHTKWNKRKWGMGRHTQTERRCPCERIKTKRQADSNALMTVMNTDTCRVCQNFNLPERTRS